MKPFISLCMIVKNEEKVIERCLSSIAHLVDEVVVVDTGSTDKTKEIVSKYTSNIYDFEWVDDFSIARNFAASKATGKWILVLDADEYVDEENFKSFTLELKNDSDQYDAYYAKILNFSGNFGEALVQNYHDRIYKNNGKISYYRKIHEQFRHNEGLELSYKNSNLLIFHSGYLKHTVSEKDKNTRNKKLIDIEMQSDNKNAFDYFNLGNEYSSIGETNKALEAYIEAYKQKSDFRLSWVSTTLIQIIICLIQLKRYNDALNVISDAETIYENSPEFLYLKGEVFYLRGQMEDAKAAFLEIVNNSARYNHIIFRPDLKDQKPHSRLGEIFLYEEDYQNAIFHYTSVLNINKHNEESINKVIFILNKFHSITEIKEFLYRSELINENNIRQYVRACFEIGNFDLALSILVEVKEENNLLYQVGLLKKIAVEKQGDLAEIQDILEETTAMDLIKSNWINIIDLYLLRDIIQEDTRIASLMEQLKGEVSLNTLIKLINEETHSENIDNDLYLTAFQILMNYKQYALCTKLLNHINSIEPNEQGKVARILFTNGFKVEALQLYEKIDWSYLKEQDFVNIINSLIQTNAHDNAVEVSKYANVLYPDDFRFHHQLINIKR
ncbi:hypothetical protein CHH83_08055 [Bacillus sp. 7586-K]|nr:hypothetical protein CHH83_08055 [Bacillus sp. 7586-K]